MLPATIAIGRKLCSLQAKQKRCSDLKSRTARNALCPETRAAGRARVIHTILYVFQPVITPVAHRAIGKLEIIHPFSEIPIFRIIPNII